MIEWFDTLDPADRARVVELAESVWHTTGNGPLSEHALLHVRAGGDPEDRHCLLTEDGRLVGYVHLDRADPQWPIAELAVLPGRPGVGEQALAALLAKAGAGGLWAHGRSSAAMRIGLAHGLPVVRQLARMTRPLADLPEPALPAGVRLREFTGADEQAWLELNREAFSELPDQGGWTAADLRARISQSWFDPSLFLLGVDSAGLVGCHWMKVHRHPGRPDLGEVYVLAVAPRARGLGLGPALTLAGLHRLRDRGLAEVMLYVDLANSPAVAMYERLGFRTADLDVQFALSGDAGPDSLAR